MTLVVHARHRWPGLDLDITFEAPGRGVTVLFGPSGSGKSTVLNIVAGLLQPEECRVGINGVVLADTAAHRSVDPDRRQTGFVFQESRLFPHMSVAANLRYGLRRRRQYHIDFDPVVDLLGLGALLDRRPHSLSGGERQRVAIGRALLSQPHLLLMDEPLASLDAARKAEIIPYLARLTGALGVPILYVTHAWDEVARLADTLVLIEAGRALACGTLSDLAVRADLPIARRDDAGAVLTCIVTAHEPARDLSQLAAGRARLLVPTVDAPLGAAVRVRIPAREVILAHGDTRGLEAAISLHNILPGTIRAIAADAARRAALVEVDLGDAAVLARVTPDAVANMALAAGVPVLALIKSMSVEIIAAL